MKSYTDLEQSKKLAKILPIESADMEYMFLKNDSSKVSNVPFVKDDDEPEWPDDSNYASIPCWSLAALLEVLPKEQHPELMINAHYKWICDISNPFSFTYEPTAGNNPLDAVFEMILKLHELKML